MKMIELMKYARIPIELNMEGVKEVAILTDTEIEPEIPEAMAVAAYQLGLEPTVVTIVKRAVQGMEPTKVMAKALLTHLDGVIESPTLYLDNRLVISEGKLQI